ncbi:hypothetical protein D3C72_1950530 [compost metagenome]
MGQAQREADQRKRGRQREGDPGRQHARPACPSQADRHADLAAGRPGQELAQGHQVRIGVVVQPVAPVHEFAAEIPEMSHRTAERRESQAQKDQEHLKTGAVASLRKRAGGGLAIYVFVLG